MDPVSPLRFMAALLAPSVHTQVQSATRPPLSNLLRTIWFTCNSEALMMTFAILGLIAFLGISLIPIYILRRQGVRPGARNISSLPSPLPGGVVQNSSIAYSLQIAAFAQFFSWGARGRFLAGYRLLGDVWSRPVPDLPTAAADARGF